MIPTARTHRSFFAYAAALLGLLSLFAVLCFHFPELLTSKEFRTAYTEQFARHLLLAGLVAAFCVGTVAPSFATATSAWRWSAWAAPRSPCCWAART